MVSSMLKFPFLVKRKQYDQLRIALFTRLSCSEIDQNKFCFMLTHSCKQYLSIAFVLFLTFSQCNFGGGLLKNSSLIYMEIS